MHTGQAPPQANIAGHPRPAAKPRKLSAHDQQVVEDVEQLLKEAKDNFKKQQASDAANAAQGAANEAASQAQAPVDAPADGPPPPDPAAAPPVRQRRPAVLVYDHHDESPEQKMAKWSKYTFDSMMQDFV